ncbi:hypothetical protein LFML04_1785 [Leptospirillum ferriphilum ML-04]|uniref:Uncharacterized protein n=1 Tax=Leptospirillum ferriphilum (strain ML-04) TaxID=1048260 RepID=J9ZBQ0_LEPFM|nr:hypothetical protein LFML04_1785 [Leptospirillum ferriphilum ML-04]
MREETKTGIGNKAEGGKAKRDRVSRIGQFSVKKGTNDFGRKVTIGFGIDTVVLANKTGRVVRALLARDQEHKKPVSRENKSFYKEEKEAFPLGSARGGPTGMTERVSPRPREPVAGNGL